MLLESGVQITATNKRIMGETMRSRHATTAILDNSNPRLASLPAVEPAIKSSGKIVLRFALAAILSGVPLYPDLYAAESEAQASTYLFNIPAQSLGDSLETVALALREKLLYSSELVDGKPAPALKGEFTTEQAVRRLLDGTDMDYTVADGLIVIRPKGTVSVMNALDVGAMVARPRFIRVADGEVGAPASSPPAAAAEVRSPELEEVVVTGSRLQAAGFTAPTPMTVVTAETIEERAPANLSDVLLEQPAIRISAGDSLRAGSGGNNPNPLPQFLIVAPDLRSLGANRTLVLLNGHRVVPATWDSQVDINIVPVGLVERIDVVTGGASAAYGSDAVSGVTNVILRNRMEGIKGGAQVGYTEYSGAMQYTANLSGGTSFMNDRLHVIAGIDYNKTEAITDVYGTQFGQDEIGNFTGANNNASAYRIVNNAPATVITTNVEPASTAVGGLYAAPSGQAYTFDANGNPVPFQRGTITGNGQLMIGSTSNYGHNLNNLTPLRIPQSRYAFMGRASYDLTDNMNVWLEFNNSQITAHPYKAGENYQSAAIGGNTPGIVIARTNPFVTPATAALLTSVGQTGTTFTIGRNNTELSFGGISGLVAQQESETRRFAAGLEGSFGNGWGYDAFVQVGRDHDPAGAQ